MGWHEWTGIVVFFAFVGPVCTLIAIGGICACIERKKADAIAAKSGSA